jgi:excisionase family DNA binding protein
MCSTILLITGLLLLFRGGFRIGERYITPERARQIAAILLLPMLVQICVTTVFFLNSDITIRDGAIDWEQFQNLTFALVDNLTTIDLLVSLIAVGMAFYLAYYAPAPSPDQAAANQMKPKRVHPLGNPPPMSDPNVLRPIPNVMTVAEAASYLRVTESDIMHLIEDGKLPAARIGDSYRIARIAVDDFISSGNV